MDEKYDGVELECQIDPMGSKGWTWQVRIKGGDMLAHGATSVSRANAETIAEEQLKRWHNNLKKERDQTGSLLSEVRSIPRTGH